jgi:hypothetical protein
MASKFLAKDFLNAMDVVKAEEGMVHVCIGVHKKMVNVAITAKKTAVIHKV